MWIGNKIKILCKTGVLLRAKISKKSSLTYNYERIKLLLWNNSTWWITYYIASHFRNHSKEPIFLITNVSAIEKVRKIWLSFPHTFPRRNNIFHGPKIEHKFRKKLSQNRTLWSWQKMGYEKCQAEQKFIKLDK